MRSKAVCKDIARQLIEDLPGKNINVSPKMHLQEHFNLFQPLFHGGKTNMLITVICHAIFMLRLFLDIFRNYN
jgi:hypothetical protein